jgi:hypothetical protein
MTRLIQAHNKLFEETQIQHNRKNSKTEAVVRENRHQSVHTPPPEDALQHPITINLRSPLDTAKNPVCGHHAQPKTKNDLGA